MRLVHAAALTVAALLLASVASAQGLGDAAAREREKRKAVPAKPGKVYTETDIGRSMPPVETTQDVPATAEGQAAAGGQPAEGQPAAEGQAPAEGQPAAEGEQPAGGAAPAPDAATKAAADAAKVQEEALAKAADDWRKRLDQARKEEAVLKDIVDKTQLQLNDTSGLYSNSRAAAVTYLEESKQKLAQAQGRITALEEEGRRNRY
jgi:hypothetical protein